MRVTDKPRTGHDENGFKDQHRRARHDHSHGSYGDGGVTWR